MDTGKQALDHEKQGDVLKETAIDLFEARSMGG